jgi:pyruvate formate lyase activating enzyme
MSNTQAISATPLETKSPFELRVGLSADVPEATVRSALATGNMGFLHSFTTGATGDGPGVRVVAWTSGCMWRCLYCHNPDTWTMTNGMLVPLSRALEELRKYRQGLNVMSGGLTLNGGEPLMQHRFAAKLFAGARAMGIHTALVTNGYYGDKLSDGELESIDLVLLDIKSWDPARHRRLTGVEVEPTLTFARRLAARRRPVWVRYMLVPGLTDDFDEIAKIAAFTARLRNVERVDVLPFHQMGRYKWKQLGISYALEHTDPPDQELVEKVCEVFRAAGLKAA